MNESQKKLFDILRENIKVTVPYCKLIDKCVGVPSPEQLKVLTVQMTKLRKELPPKFIVMSVRNKGYMMLKK